MAPAESFPRPERLSARVLRLRAPNPGPMTLTGTNTYLVGSGSELVVIDPGPQIEDHLLGLVAAAQELKATISLILVTHGHPDHFPGAERLAALTGALVGAYREAEFPHQLDLADRQRVQAAGCEFQAIFTPGHAQDHLCFFLEEEQALFTGDNILGQGTTVVAPPKGDMARYMASLHLLEEGWGQANVIYGGHGPEIPAVSAKLREYIEHRQMRRRQVLDALVNGPQTIPQMVERIYYDVDRRLWPAAARQVLAILNLLESEDRVSAVDLPPVEVTASDREMLYPGAVIVDPVAAAELGITGPDGDTTGVVKRYTLAAWQ